ncbi:MAG TPA: nickel-binding protein, partial [Puia sp.]|nr:nickel-binding protein [Puia sp.]
MPIFMDRHDVSGSVTAEQVALLHQEDLKVQDRFGCRGLTYWFDEKRKTAFCLVEAPDRQSLQQMHQFAHGEVPNRIIEVAPAVVESFLGRIEDPKKEGNSALNIIKDPGFRTLMVVSLNLPVLPKNKARPDTASPFRKYRDGMNKTLKTYRGKIVKTSDHRQLISFSSATQAIRAAEDIRSSFRKLINQKIEWELKIGLDAGDAVTNKPSLFEDTVRLAERMCETVRGQIIVSAEVRDLYKHENKSRFISGRHIIPLSRADERFLTGLMNFMDSSWTNVNLKVGDFAKPTGFSKSRLYRKMVQLTGKSLHAFIKEYRLKKSIELLAENAGNISEVAFGTGFSSPSY